MIEELKKEIKKCKTEDEYYDVMYLFDKKICEILFDDEACRKTLCKVFNQDEKTLEAILMIHGCSYPDNFSDED